MGEVKGWSYNLLLKTWNVNVAIRVAKSGLCFLTSFLVDYKLRKGTCVLIPVSNGTGYR